MLRPRIILFLSTGDTCRSPMAATYLRHLLDKHGVRGVDVRTAGVSTIVGLLASQETHQVLKAEELDASRHRSSQLTTAMLQRADIIFGMTPFHVQRALRMTDAARGKTFLLKEFAKSDLKKVQIDDPMGGTLEIYRKCFTEIKDALDRIIFMPEAIGSTVKPLPEEKALAARVAKVDSKPSPAEKPKAIAKPRTPAKPKPAPKAKKAKKPQPKPKKKAKAAKPRPKSAKSVVKKKKVAKKPAKARRR
ncbi:hypothetical protein EDM76_13910 [bacterium]|nr:MAG: hypothetical protein EDM76_13910 [bacterium]